MTNLKKQGASAAPALEGGQGSLRNLLHKSVLLFTTDRQRVEGTLLWESDCEVGIRLSRPMFINPGRPPDFDTGAEVQFKKTDISILGPGSADANERGAGSTR